MKNLAILFLLFSSFCFCQKYTVELPVSENDSILGNVKSVREKVIYLKDTIYNYHDEDEIGDYGHYGFSGPETEISILERDWYHTTYTSFLNYEKIYNEKRELTEETWFDKKDSLYRKYSYKYSERGNKIQIVTTYRDEEDLAIHNFYYDKKGLLRTDVRTFLDNPEFYFYTVYSYNSDGKLTQKRYFDEYGERSGWKYEYDEKGRKTKIIRHDPNKEIDQLQKAFHYDNYGNVVKEESYDLNDDRSKYELKVEKRYSYDQKNLIITECINSYRYYSYRYCISNQYNKEGLLEEKTDRGRETKYRYKDGRIVILEYDETLEYEENTFKRTKAFIQFKYEFDLKGNWIKQTKIVNGVPLYVRVRDIKYFENR